MALLVNVFKDLREKWYQSYKLFQEVENKEQAPQIILQSSTLCYQNLTKNF